MDVLVFSFSKKKITFCKFVFVENVNSSGSATNKYHKK